MSFAVEDGNINIVKLFLRDGVSETMYGAASGTVVSKFGGKIR